VTFSNKATKKEYNRKFIDESIIIRIKKEKNNVRYPIDNQTIK